ncbi:hypothetical protein [Kumtagia ephedrae]|uniref:Uncharacterized protein n=1 Tax=Kumtagia ephedrae TaxID=2116701 RepID=A0A2P7SSZ4_9HYPH|nr:hypothetical protein [Mesorhizobium ephedrae]PSJ65618.1 hypothetical protein C7I84_00355 [Mesorhizobium ephedrae]
MDWDAAIDKNREALKRIVAMLLAMAGLDAGELRGQFTLFRQKGGSGSGLARAEKSKLSPALAPALDPALALPRRLHRAILRLLRPAEAAVRRLIVVAARGLVVTLPPPRQKPPPKYRPGAGPVRMPARPKARARRTSLPLLDPLKPWNRRPRRAPRGVPRISCPGYSEPFRIPVWSPNDPIDASRLDARLRALVLALDDLPGQARRFARWRARRDAALARERESGCLRRFGRFSPLKPGRPPGWQRKKPVHEVHEVLDVVHGLAQWALEPADTS